MPYFTQVAVWLKIELQIHQPTHIRTPTEDGSLSSNRNYNKCWSHQHCCPFGDQKASTYWTQANVSAKLAAFTFMNRTMDLASQLFIGQCHFKRENTSETRHLRNVLQCLGHNAIEAILEMSLTSGLNRLRHAMNIEPRLCVWKLAGWRFRFFEFYLKLCLGGRHWTISCRRRLFATPCKWEQYTGTGWCTTDTNINSCWKC